MEESGKLKEFEEYVKILGKLKESEEPGRI
jgi:hypothetical protein